ncbi:hypothetical protein [Bittarella massiliensis (ex Durand et al. 2017)]|uniref:ComEC/Rec2-related protein domain-containing protein n=1 Tax=Bittarella massiliensis (ex Durand et al. 2017) TaxID=1720313 RepID=A0ABW9WU12_9FIRM|nr:hypothetical protein [Bittarella massiliensis (ex Durand et al. 2017)]MZL69289.1 hypothetical protein [Bittarella massiliensis (ex Durand et al. 2017)]MZL79169.1 hypothetical protein [Bittarella massiliensis (ex Durand et al. 2017)]
MVRRRQQTYPETVGARCGAALAGTLLRLSPAAALPFLQVLAATGCGRLRGEWAWVQLALLGWSPAVPAAPLPLPLYASPAPFVLWLVSASASLWGAGHGPAGAAARGRVGG